jgi:hypothetical protein
MTGLPSKFSVALWSWFRARRTARQQYAQHVTSVAKKDHL